MKPVAIYDTSLRDGTQAEEINLTPEDKVRIAVKLDELGVAYIEGGWPGSNPTDKRFFKDIKNYELKHAQVAAFGSTHNPKSGAENDANLKALLACEAQVLTIFGKTWDLHVKDALRVTNERNLGLITDSLRYLKPHCRELFFDAEHFFDGFKANRDYALACLKTAQAAGADVLVLCDTNGGSLPHEIGEIMDAVAGALPGTRLGIHCHNDSELAVANTLTAVAHGAVQVQGTVNGIGERCGNANLCSIIPALELKMDRPCLPAGKLALLTQISHFVSEVCNLRPFFRQPFVGRSAFAHKGGIHVSAVVRNPKTYEHIDPKAVGNIQRVLLSDLSGRSNILFMASKYFPKLDKEDPCVETLLSEVKEREALGYEYSTAEASFILLFFRTMGWSKRYFELINFRVLDEKRRQTELTSEATVMIKVRGQTYHTAACGVGPVNALDNALRKALEEAYPSLKEMRLIDFKVRVLSGYMRDTGGTASNVRVLIESGDSKDKWTTVGLSPNVIDASWQALVDSITYKLFKDDPQKWPQKADL
jgi:2-isopropylmalate synthase